MSDLFRAAVAPVVVGLAVLLFTAELRAQAQAFPPVSTPMGPPSGAQPGGDADAPKKPVMTPPKLKKFVDAVYPPEALAQGIGARVELELLIAPDGTVQDAKVVTPVGQGFDEAALQAARQFEFEPASRDGQPIASRVRYPYVFEIKVAPEPEPEPEAPPPPGRLEGQVLGAENKAPIADAEVTVTSPDGQIAKKHTDAEGRFAFDDLVAGNYDVRVQAKDRQPANQQEELRSGEATSVTYRLLEPVDTEAFGATARIEPPPREVTRRTIGKKELTRIPGTRGDALRTVELMPGVARPPGGTGVLIVRGSAPLDSEYLFDGLPVQLVYHFGGITSIVNSHMIESLDFYPGSFNVRYGRHRGGVLQINSAELPRDKFHGIADFNLFDSSVLVQTQVGKDAEVAVAARRSNVEWLGAALKNQNVATIAAPVYYDYQAIATYRPSDRDKLRLMAYGSSDHLKLLFSQSSDTDSSLSGNFNYGTEFHRVHGSWRRQLSDSVDQDIDLGIGYVNADLVLGQATTFNSKGSDIYQRSEWTARVNDHVRLITGLDMFFLPGDFTYQGPPVHQAEGDPSNPFLSGTGFSNSSKVAIKEQFLVAQPAVYVESDITFAPWVFILGSRVDYYSEIKGYSYDPRGSVLYSLTETTKLKAAAGIFSQPPAPYESLPKLGNPQLKPQHAVHLGLGVDQTITEGITAGVEGFYKHFYSNVVGTPFGQAPFLTNDGRGRSFGMEVNARINPGGRFLGYLSYTLMRSERIDHSGSPWRLFDYDQTHILTVAGVYKLGRGWEMGATLRLYSGNPITPIVGSTLNTGTGQYSPIYGAVNSDRNPTYNRVDVRFEKQWTFSDWKLALYLDIQNVYNARNPDGVVNDYEFRKREFLQGFPPFLPILGLRGEI